MFYIFPGNITIETICGCALGIHNGYFVVEKHVFMISDTQVVLQSLWFRTKIKLSQLILNLHFKKAFIFRSN